MSTCTLPRCNGNVESYGLCSMHYRVRLNSGVFGLVDAAPVVEHIRKLQDLGWSLSAIGREMGANHTTPADLMRGDYSRVRTVTAKALLSIELRPMPSRRRLSAIGTRRRVDALNWMGWSNTDISAQAGLKPESLSKILWKGTLSYATAFAVDEVYQKLSSTTGPNARAAARARRRGYASPFAWEYLDMDDADARPNTGGYDEATVQALIAGQRPDYAPADLTEAVQRLSHLTYIQIAKQLRIPRPTCYSAARRAAA